MASVRVSSTATLSRRLAPHLLRAHNGLQQKSSVCNQTKMSTTTSSSFPPVLPVLTAACSTPVYSGTTSRGAAEDIFFPHRSPPTPSSSSTSKLPFAAARSGTSGGSKSKSFVLTRSCRTRTSTAINMFRNKIGGPPSNYSKNVFQHQTQARSYTSYSELPEEVQMIREQAKQFTEDVLFQTAAKNDVLHTFPKDEIKQLGELGFLGMNVPEKYGGPGMSALAYAVAMEEISRGCPSCGLLLSINNSLYCGGLVYFGSEKQKEEVLPGYLFGEKIGCFALSEPGNGSDAAAAATTAVEKDDHYLLNGTKQWISNSYEGASTLVFATTDKQRKHKGISCFLVPLPNFPDENVAGSFSSSGVKLGQKEDKLGIRASSTAQVIMEDCQIPKENLVGQSGDGFKIAMKLLDGGRIGIAGQALGIAQASLECAVKYANERYAFGEKIGKYYAVHEKLADMDLQIWSARLLTWQAACMKDRGEEFTRASARCKYAASKAATFCANEAIQILGGMGYVSDMPAERYFRDARITEIYEGTSEINKMVIGQKVLKEMTEVDIVLPAHYRAH
ncbi:unnamed protein product [Amoebophrya sp. A120]|nr:unnamed protein product [Amoebophrya sp. A120]|eukprot:GSA120T00008999001.1